jgi:hypothetical protein
MRWYDRTGKPLTDMAEIERLLRDREYKVVAYLEEKRDDETTIRISTVWLGLDHRWGEGPPVIFETMIFIETPHTRAKQKFFRETMREAADALNRNKPEEMPEYPGPQVEDHPLHTESWRWSTEAEAKKGHELVVAAFRENKDPNAVINAWREEERKESMI